jgi:ribosome-associated protein
MSDEEIDVSKSERKRQASHLQNLGKRLSELRDSELHSLDLPTRLLDAIADYRRFPSHEAKRRQLQYVGKVMRDVDDIAAIQELLDRHDGASAAQRHEFHLLEQWRERLINNEADALTEYLNAYPNADRQRLRQQLQRIHKAKDETRQKAAARELFRMLREFA